MQPLLALFCLLALVACATPPVEEASSAAGPAAVATRPASRPAGMPLRPAQTLSADRAPLPAGQLENSIFFKPGSAAIDEQGESRLRQHADRLKADDRQVVTLVGHTDDLGSTAYNLAIADMRVNAVFQLLRKFGVPSKQLRRFSVGNEKGPANCRSETCRQQMRRVELEYSGS